GFSLDQLDLSAAEDFGEALEKIRNFETEQEWLLGTGFTLNLWGEERLTSAALDEIWLDRPVAFTSQDLHSAWLNSKAIELLGFSADTPDPDSGRISRDAEGVPNGLFFEAAARMVWERQPEPSEEAIRRALRNAADHLAAMGITTVHHMAYETVDRWRGIAD